MKKFEEVFEVFEKNYVLVPLEIFGDDAYKTLVSTIMSARTNDDTTLVAAERLFEKASDIYELAKLNTDEIEKLIFPVGFYKTKAKHLKMMAEIVVEKYKGVIPNTQEELMSLPGVGQKTANLVLNRAFNIPAIAVDTHVHRISNMLGWVNTKTPQQTEIELIKVVPKKYWSQMNRVFVSIGRQYRSERQVKEFLRENGLI
jgi:endonuclease III